MKSLLIEKMESFFKLSVDESDLFWSMSAVLEEMCPLGQIMMLCKCINFFHDSCCSYFFFFLKNNLSPKPLSCFWISIMDARIRRLTN